MKMNSRYVLTLKVAALICIVLISSGCRPSPTSFYYRMASLPDDGDTTFYEPPSSDSLLSNPSGQEVRNVILCIGDGMGFEHVALARHFSVGDVHKLHMERLPIQGAVTTRSASNAVTDSAAAATAMATGIKTNNGMISMAPDETPYSTILELLQTKGWRTGLVATSAISHATPAGFASHVDSRDKQKEIARQLLDNRVDVMLGGGQKYWSDDLLAEARIGGYQMIENRDQMLALNPAPVIGLFADDGMDTVAPEPMLPEMADVAIKLLNSPGKEWFSPTPKFFLMIEGSQIDWAAHANETDRTIRQTLLFEMAVRQAVDFARADKKTLVIVTADHETGGLKLEPTDDGGLKAKWTSGNHTGARVPLYAYGPGSEKFAGTMDNTDIPKRIADLMGIETFPITRALVQSANVRE